MALFNANNSKVWKANENGELFLPLDVRPILVDAAKPTGKGEKRTYQTNFISCPDPSTLTKYIGAEAYVSLVKSVAQHPLLKPLIDASFPTLMGAPDIIFALRALAMKPLPSAAAAMLTEVIFSQAAASISKPIELQHVDKMQEGMSKADHSKAIRQYETGINVRAHAAGAATPSPLTYHHRPPRSSALSRCHPARLRTRSLNPCCMPTPSLRLLRAEFVQVHDAGHQAGLRQVHAQA